MGPKCWVSPSVYIPVMSSASRHLSEKQQVVPARPFKTTVFMGLEHVRVCVCSLRVGSLFLQPSGSPESKLHWLIIKYAGPHHLGAGLLGWRAQMGLIPLYCSSRDPKIVILFWVS